MIDRALFALVMLFPASVLAEFPLQLPPGAQETWRDTADPGTYALPIGTYDATEQPQKLTEGRILTRAWRLPEERGDTFAVLRAVRGQLAGAGYRIIFECDARTCGGFDFRFNTDVIAPPAMEVTLSDFRFLSAMHGGDDRVAGVLVSRSPRGGFVQMVEVLPSQSPAPELVEPRRAASVGGAPDVAEVLERRGALVLEQVVFDSGATALGEESVDALTPLAAFLDADPTAEILIVGHTDSVGGLDGNIALSRARARAVRDALIGRFGIDPGRIGAEGAGYLAPRDTNTTEAGRARNRRVEAVLR